MYPAFGSTDLASAVQDRVHVEVVGRGIQPIVELVGSKVTDGVTYQINPSNDPWSSRVPLSQIQ